MTDPLFGHAVAAGFALLLLAAAWHKAGDRAQFATTLGDYRLLPAWLLRPAASLLPIVEMGIAVAWLTRTGRIAAATATVALLIVYATAIAINLLRGRVHITCGCGLAGGAGADTRLSWWLVARNLLLATAAGGAALPASGRELAGYDWLTLALALAAAVLLYAGASQLLRNGAAIAAWRTRD